MSRELTISESEIKHAHDALCRAHKLSLHLDAVDGIRREQDEIVESELTRALEAQTNALKAVMERQGIAW